MNRLSSTNRVSSSTTPTTSAGLAAHLEQVRRQTMQLALPLSAEDCALQSMPDASPVKWHLAHTTWFYETFILEPGVSGYRLFNPQFRVLFNSYYVTVGPRHPRPERGLLSRPSLQEVCAYRRHVDAELTRLLSTAALPPTLIRLIELGIHHEQQHQELMLTDTKHLLSRNPLQPTYVDADGAPVGSAAELKWLRQPDGIRQVGHGGSGFCFDNEQPRHRVFLDAFQMASRPVTNGEYAEFIAGGGYQKPELWLSEGWDLKTAQGWQAPLYWVSEGNHWSVFTLHGIKAVQPDEPVCHVSYFEADAYARWAQARLPTEAEWETLAAPLSISGNFLEHGHYHPQPCPPALPGTVQQVYGDVWEWTRSSYEPYPGFRAPHGAIGEYNGKFMANQYVLRGGSCATPTAHIRATYRNFFPAGARWQFSGIRLARDSA